jgi:hypothetical protein
MLSARDVRIVERWARAGIPVDVVEAGVQHAFSGNTPARVRGLAYTVPAVEQAVRAWRQRSLGESSASPEPVANDDDALSGLADRLDAVDHPACHSAAEAVRGLRGRDASPEVLATLEFEMCVALVDSAPAHERAALDAQVEARTAGQRIDEASRTAQLHRAVRERFGLPRCVLHREAW